MRREKPNIKVTVKWQRIEGEPPPLWSKLWDKLLAPNRLAPTRHDTGENEENGEENP